MSISRLFRVILLSFPVLIFIMDAEAQTTKKTITEKPEEVTPLKVGEKVPNIGLVNADGLAIKLQEIIQKQPTVLIFYRGGWCVYCNRHLGALKTIEEPLQKLGYQIIAISPDSVEKLRESLKKNQVNYMLLSDAPAEVIQAFGLAFKLDDATFEKYKNQYGIDIEKDSGYSHHLLPVPAAFIVNKDGVIQYRYYNPNYKERVDPQELLKAAQANIQK